MHTFQYFLGMQKLMINRLYYLISLHYSHSTDDVLNRALVTID